MVRVTEESEYQDALRQGRAAIGIPWPAKHMVVVTPPLETVEAPESTAEETTDATAPTEESELQTPSSRPSWWKFWR